MPAILYTTLDQVLATFTHNWPFLLLGAVVAAALKVYAEPAAIARFFRGHAVSSVLLATLVAVATPFCSCGTMAVILGMMASSVPWAPIVAFMAASPLTSPEETVISAGLFGWPFALTLLAASVVIGLGAGAAAHFFEARGWLAGQARLRPAPTAPPSRPATTSCCPQPAPLLPVVAACCSAPAATAGASAAACCALPSLALPVAWSTGAGEGARAPECCSGRHRRRIAEPARSLRLPALRDELLSGGARLLIMFGGFAFLGYFVNNLIPAAWVAALFGHGNRLGVPLAALVGLPLYLNSDGSLPMIRAFVDNGAGAGAALAFIVTGAGTSLGAISGALTIARWRVVAIVIAALLLGAVVAGYGFDLLLAPAR